MVESILNSGEWPSRRTNLINHHRKSGRSLIEYYRRRGYNLAWTPPTCTIRNPEDVVPPGTKKVEVRCHLETVTLPPSVEELVIGRRAFIRNVPAVPILCPYGGFLNLSPAIQVIDGADGRCVSQKFLERMTGLRAIYSQSPHPLWIPPWLEEATAQKVDPESLANSRLKGISLESLDGVTLPPTIRHLELQKYNGETLPDGLESLHLHCHSKIPTLPTGLRVLWLSGENARGVQIPSGVTELHLDGVGVVANYPPLLEKLSISRAKLTTKVPSTVREAHFEDCETSIDVYSDAKCLRTLTISNCQGSFGDIPGAVTSLTVRGSISVTLPCGLVQLECPVPVDLIADEQIIGALCLEEYERDDRNQTSEISINDIAMCRNLKRLRFA